MCLHFEWEGLQSDLIFFLCVDIASKSILCFNPSILFGNAEIHRPANSRAGQWAEIPLQWTSSHVGGNNNPESCWECFPFPSALPSGAQRPQEAKQWVNMQVIPLDVLSSCGFREPSSNCSFMFYLPFSCKPQLVN